MSLYVGKLAYLGTDGWGSGEELRDAILVDGEDKIKELNIFLAKSLLIGEVNTT